MENEVKTSKEVSLEKFSAALGQLKLLNDKRNMLLHSVASGKQGPLYDEIKSQIKERLEGFNAELEKFGYGPISFNTNGKTTILSNFRGKSIVIEAIQQSNDGLNTSTLEVKLYQGYYTLNSYNPGNMKRIEKELPCVFGVNDNLQYSWQIGSTYVSTNEVVDEIFSWIIMAHKV